MRQTRQHERDQVLATGQRVAALMRERRVSLASLAATVRLQQSTLQGLCSGQRMIPADVLESIASELGTTVGYLRAVTDDPFPYGLALSGDAG